MKKARKVLFYTLLAIGVLLTMASASLWLFKDDIIREFIKEANKNLNTPVRIGKVDVSLWSDFPDLSIVFTDVYVEDSHPGNYPLLTASRISCSLNAFDVWKGRYAIKGLAISNSETNLKIDEGGVSNYNIVKKQPEDSAKSVGLDLKNVSLKNTLVRYHDVRSHSDHVFKSTALTASISLQSDLYDIDATGDVTTEQINTGKQVFLKNKTFEIKSHLQYDNANVRLIINPSTIKTNKSQFEIKGNYSFGKKEQIDLTASAKNTDIQTILSLLPDETAAKLAAYRSDGEIYLTVALKGKMDGNNGPGISVAFKCRDARLYHPEYKSKIDHATMEGSFATPSLNDLTHASLFLRHISGELNGKVFSAEYSMEDFDNPFVGLDFKGELDAASLLGFYPVEEISELKGEINADVSFQGRIALLKKRSTAQKVKTRGSIEMRDIELTAGKQHIKFTEVGGTLQFNNNDLALSDVKGKFESSDFMLNGFFKNVITWFLFEGQPLGIQADLKSNFLDIDRLLSIGFSEKGSGDFNFQISPELHLNFNCDIKSLRYQRFKARDIRGDLMVNNQKAVSRNINLKTMGGDVSLNGIVDARNPKAINIASGWKLSGIYIDSVFYVFHNFDQAFIEDRHLKGQTYADVNVEMSLSEKLNLYPETLIADISAVIKNGELNKFEPLQSLNKYLDDEGLSRLRFADLKNDIHIEKKTVYIPQMEIRSNVTTIQVSGTHTFDQRIDYRVAAPLRSKKKIDTDAAFGAIEEDNTGHAKLFLKITGTTSQYTVSYDKEAVKKKIKNDLKKEVQELKDAFKNKGIKKKKEAELEKDEYFDWDNKDQ